MAKAKEVLRVSVLPIVIGLFGQWFAIDLPNFTVRLKESSIKDFESFCYQYPTKKRVNKPKKEYQLFLQKDFIGFKEALAFKESQRRYSVVNKFGYLGKYQFAKGTLALVGINDTLKFLNSPILQEAAFKAYVSRNKWVLRRDIKRYIGKKINGILVTESGIVAAAHLVGPGSVKKFLRSNGSILPKDGFGTSIVEYMDKFKSYDLSDIPSDRMAKAFKI